MARFFKNNSTPNEVSKNLTLITELSITKKYPYDMENPRILVKNENNVINANYMINDGLNYFITKKTEVNGGLLEIECECDYLSSAWGTIKGQVFLVERQENKRNSMIHDNELILQANENLYVKTFGNTVNDDDDYKIYLTVNGGGGE